VRGQARPPKSRPAGRRRKCLRPEGMAMAKKSKKSEFKSVRPWGRYFILEEKPGWKVKRIQVKPGQRLSCQRHFRRREHWVIVAGEAVVTLGNREIALKPGQSVDIPVKVWHRIKNPGQELLAFIEIQQGGYFGEDDIERSEDDYGRS